MNSKCPECGSVNLREFTEEEATTHAVAVSLKVIRLEKQTESRKTFECQMFECEECGLKFPKEASEQGVESIGVEDIGTDIKAIIEGEEVWGKIKQVHAVTKVECETGIHIFKEQIITSHFDDSVEVNIPIIVYNQKENPIGIIWARSPQVQIMTPFPV